MNNMDKWLNLQMELEQLAAEKKLGFEECGSEKANQTEAHLSALETTAKEESIKEGAVNSLDLCHCRRSLPLEMNCEIFKFLSLEIQQKFIWGMGRGIYGMFGDKVLAKTKRVRNPKKNRWDRSKTKAQISPDGLNARDHKTGRNARNNIGELVLVNVFAEKGFAISGPKCREDNFPGNIIYYYEVKQKSSSRRRFWQFNVGLSGATMFTGYNLRFFNNFHAIPHGGDLCWLLSLTLAYYYFECSIGDVVGCGIVLTSQNEVAIFFTLNGILIDKQIPIQPSADCLYPKVSLHNISLDVNFGNDLVNKPFKYDIVRCPGLVFN